MADVVDRGADNAGRQSSADHSKHDRGVHATEKSLVDEMSLSDEMDHECHPSQAFLRSRFDVPPRTV
jgi:hypothetical protein